MHLVLDGQGALHAQLTRSLKQAILARRFAAGMRLPATRELAVLLGLSRNTVLGAYEQLEAEGFIEARTGSGSYVADIAPRELPTLPKVDRTMRIARFGRRAQELRAHLPPGRRRLKLRYNLEYGLPLVTPALQSAWRRALGKAADDTVLDYPPANGLPELREAIAGYLGRRRGLDVDPDALRRLATLPGSEALLAALIERRRGELPHAWLDAMPRPWSPALSRAVADRVLAAWNDPRQRNIAGSWLPLLALALDPGAGGVPDDWHEPLESWHAGQRSRFLARLLLRRDFHRES